MRLYIPTLLASLSATLVASYGTSGVTINQLTALLPFCSHVCFVQGVPKVGCSVLDHACQCKKTTEITALITDCIITGCGLPGALDVSAITTEICALEVEYNYALPGTSTVPVAASVSSAVGLLPTGATTTGASAASTTAEGGLSASATGAAVKRGVGAAVGVVAVAVGWVL